MSETMPRASFFRAAVMSDFKDKASTRRPAVTPGGRPFRCGQGRTVTEATFQSARNGAHSDLLGGNA